MEDKKSDLTQRRYKIKCKIKFVKKTVSEDVGKGVVKHYERKLVLLIPQESDERSRFLTAWLPDSIGEYFELVAFASYPVDSPCRLSIHRADSQSDRHYMTVMSKGVEDVLVCKNEGDFINLETYAAAEDEEADFAAAEQKEYEVFE